MRILPCSKGVYLCFVVLARNTYKLRGKHRLTKNSSYPFVRSFVVNSPADDFLAGVRSPVLIRISSSFDDQNTLENNHLDCKRWPISGIKRRTNWDLKQNSHTQHWYVKRSWKCGYFSVLLCQKSILCLYFETRCQKMEDINVLCKEKRIFMTLLGVNEHLVMRIVT